MASQFKKIALFGRSKRDGLRETLLKLQEYLQAQAIDVLLEAETAQQHGIAHANILPFETIGQQCDLMIVVGGDGSLLQAAKSVVDHDVPIVGINRGRLGFLTDILPDEITAQIGAILAGQYKEEPRFLLTAQVVHGDTVTAQQDALNDVVLMQGDNPHMIEYEIYIDKQFVCSHRGDGLITATPTGSTAYALSGGGPILHPSLDACVLLPMYPHTLSARPIVINGNSEIKVVISPENEFSARVSCDAQTLMKIHAGDHFTIRKKAKPLRLIHPLDYQYFQTLRSKLQWGSGHLK